MIMEYRNTGTQETVERLPFHTLQHRTPKVLLDPPEWLLNREHGPPLDTTYSNGVCRRLTATGEK